MDNGTIAAILGLPQPWPPSEEVLVVSYTEPSLELRADSRGRLALSVTTSAGTTQAVFRPLRIEGSGMVSLIVTWSTEETNLYIDGIHIEPDSDGASEHLVTTKVNPHYKACRLFLTLDPNDGKDKSERLFLATLDDIDQKAHTGTSYDLIRAAGMLRQLLLDGPQSLVHIVNRAYRKRLEFEIVETEPPPVPFDKFWWYLDPGPYPEADRVPLSLDQFLQLPFLATATGTATVRHLIKACANVKGGVHLGTPDGAEQEMLIELDDAFRVLGEESSTTAIRGLCRIVLNAMRPLVLAISASAH